MKNKINLVVVFMVVISTIAFGQQKIRTTDFPTFKKWSSEIVINGYKQGDVEDENSINFIANYFAGTTKLIQLSVCDISFFRTMASPTQQSQKYLFGSNNALFFSSPENSFLAVEYKQSELCVSIAATGKVEKAFLETILTKSNPNALYNLSASGSKGIKWPASIPESFKITNVVSIEKAEPDGYYTEIYELNAKFSNELINNLQALMAKHNTSSLSESIKDGKAQLICADAETIDQLKEQFKQGQLVKFIVYIK